MINNSIISTKKLLKTRHSANWSEIQPTNNN